MIYLEAKPKTESHWAPANVLMDTESRFRSMSDAKEAIDVVVAHHPLVKMGIIEVRLREEEPPKEPGGPEVYCKALPGAAKLEE